MPKYLLAHYSCSTWYSSFQKFCSNDEQLKLKSLTRVEKYDYSRWWKLDVMLMILWYLSLFWTFPHMNWTLICWICSTNLLWLAWLSIELCYLLLCYFVLCSLWLTNFFEYHCHWLLWNIFSLWLVWRGRCLSFCLWTRNFTALTLDRSEQRPLACSVLYFACLGSWKLVSGYCLFCFSSPLTENWFCGSR